MSDPSPDPTPDSAPEPAVGDEIELEIGPVAHGGHCVARWDGRVVFVRHALPGESALVRITDVSHRAFLRGDAVAVLRPDPRRVTPRCSHFVPGGCGGCDFQHASADLQRELKAAVVVEQLSRLAGIDSEVTVEALPGDGFGWRSRVRWALDDGGRIGPRMARSHQVVPISGAAPCEIAAPGLSEHAAALGVPGFVRAARGTSRRRGRSGGRLPEVTITATDDGPSAHWAADRHVAPLIIEHAGGTQFRVAADGFWQVHPAAAQTLADTVRDAIGGVALEGATAWDLYGGVGLFGAVLSSLVGEGGQVVTVENDVTATSLAELNLAGGVAVAAVTADVGTFLSSLPADAASPTAVVLDPPRSGAGGEICAAIAAHRPQVIVYVACDPAALARDTAHLQDAGYTLDALRAFDCFPQTHHVECVARFIPGTR